MSEKLRLKELLGDVLPPILFGNNPKFKELTGLSPRTIANEVSRGRGPEEIIKVNRKLVGYPRDAFIRWLESRTQKRKRYFKKNNKQKYDQVADQRGGFQISPEKNGHKLIGAKNIENYLKRDWIALVVWKSSYGFPLKKEDGLPVLYLADLDAWLDAHGIILQNLSTSFLREYYFWKRRFGRLIKPPDDEHAEINDAN